MFSLTPSELLTIGILALIVFGPRRLPEIARRAGQLISSVRSTAAEIKGEVQGELDAVAEPFREAAADLTAEGESLKETAAALEGEVKGQLEEVAEPFREAASDLAAEGKSLKETAEGELKWVDEDPR